MNPAMAKCESTECQAISAPYSGTANRSEVMPLQAVASRGKKVNRAKFRTT
jgi:hypothetical protein